MTAIAIRAAELGKHYGQHGIRDTRWPGVLLMNLSWDHQVRED